MTMQTVEWHKDCLKNMRHHLKREQEIAIRQAERAQILKDRTDMYQNQIDRAVREAKPGFDSERYNIPRHLRNNQ